MIFEVTRTSMWSKEKPYENCIPITLTNVDWRTFKSPEEHDARLAKQCGNWFSRGSNHRVINGTIARDMGSMSTWGIEINSLEELMIFKEAVGEDLVLSISCVDHKTPCIEIYDDYRE